MHVRMIIRIIYVSVCLVIRAKTHHTSLFTLILLRKYSDLLTCFGSVGQTSCLLKSIAYFCTERVNAFLGLDHVLGASTETFGHWTGILKIPLEMYFKSSRGHDGEVGGVSEEASQRISLTCVTCM